MIASLDMTASLCFLLLCFLVLKRCDGNGGWGISVDERHAFSLSTFNPKGQLQQVDYAMEAAALGTPVLVVCRPQDGTLLMAAPQVLPSIFIVDDGTARFLRVTSNLLIAHSGISADGRVLCAAAQELAVQHEFVYDEEIPIDIFLEEVSLLYQEYTMKPNTRPFGATMIVAHQAANIDDNTNTKSTNSTGTTPHCFYRIDPSGSVECLGDNFGVINGGDKFQKDNQLMTALRDISQDPESQSIEETRRKLVQVLLESLRRASKETTLSSSKGDEEKVKDSHDDDGAKEFQRIPATLKNVRRILTASISREEGMTMDRFELSRGEIMDAGAKPES